VKGRLPLVLLAAALAALAWAAWTVTVEYYDGFEYLLTARTLLGSRLYFFPKNPALSGFLALVEAPWRAAGGSLGLRGFHVAMLALNAAGALAAAAWLRRVGVRLSLAAAGVVVVCTRLYFHYALFAMADLPAAFAVAAYLWAQTAEPLATRRGRLTRAASLALCALGRPQAALIPAAALLAEAVREKRPLQAAWTAAAAAAVAAAALGVFYWIAGAGFFAGIALHAQLVRNQYRGNFGGADAEPAWTYAVYLARLLTPVGAALALGGLWEFSRRERRSLRRALAGPALGAGVYLLLMCAMPRKETRYLSPLLPFCALAQCLALERLSKWRAWAAPLALAALFVSAAPELARFAEPFYRADRERSLSEEIASWSGARHFYFFGDSAPLHPERFVFDRADDYFYVYHWQAPAFMFFTGLPASRVPALFSRAGWPIPNGIADMPADAAAVSPSPGPMPTSRLPESVDVVYAFRRGPNGVEQRAFPLR